MIVMSMNTILYITIIICVITGLLAYVNLLQYESQSESIIKYLETKNDTDDLVDAYRYCLGLENNIGQTKFYNETCSRIRNKLIKVYNG